LKRRKGLQIQVGDHMAMWLPILFASTSLSERPESAAATEELPVRTVTTGVTLTEDQSRWGALLAAAAANNALVSGALERQNFVVQTQRVSLNPLCEYADCADRAALLSTVKVLDAIAARLDLFMLNLGPVEGLDAIDAIPDIMAFGSPRLLLSAPASLDADGLPDYDKSLRIARSVLAVGAQTVDGSRNFQWTASFNMKPGVPFFPAGYHAGPMSFAVGCQTAGIVRSAFRDAHGNLTAAKANLRTRLQAPMTKIEAIARGSAAQSGVAYGGIDVSVAPGPDDGLADAYESLGLGHFGSSGTLFISSLITSTVRSLAVTKVGYSGLMLPVAEDASLAKRANASLYSIHDLLTYSAVCGMGIDTVPIPGSTPPEKVAHLLMDVAALAWRLDKPLAARLLPAPGKEAGDLTSFTDPLLLNTRVFAVP